MKKTIVGTLVAAIILFMWQFLSWSILNIHGVENTYTPNQDKIINFLEQNLEEGSYFLPTMPPDTSPEEKAEMMKSVEGKPWATVVYHDAYHDTMGMNMFRGFVANLLIAFLLCWILMRMKDLTLASGLLTSLFIGFIGYMIITYIHTIWFETYSLGYLIDTIVQFGLVGLWLGWWLSRE
jgi:hypothetical protein